MNNFIINVESTIDYYPFGMQMQGRVFTATSSLPYRFGFNGQLKDNEITGVDGAHTTAMFWEYDSRIGRRWNIDPEFKKYPWQSNYACFDDSPIFKNDPLGNYSPDIHANLTNNAGLQSKLTSSQISWLVLGAKNADYLGFAEEWHFDNRKNYNEVAKSWNLLYSRIQGRSSSDYYGLGADLHNVQDFYAHSNYVELYVDYYKNKNDGVFPGEVPIFNEGIKDKAFKKILKTSLRTGEFSMKTFLIEKIFGVPIYKSKNHHDNMNKDNGAKDGAIGKLSEETAAKHTSVIIESKENNSTYGGELKGVEVKAKK